MGIVSRQVLVVAQRLARYQVDVQQTNFLVRRRKEVDAVIMAVDVRFLIIRIIALLGRLLRRGLARMDSWPRV
jgi:hypothetical protein